MLPKEHLTRKPKFGLQPGPRFYVWSQHWQGVCLVFPAQIWHSQHWKKKELARNCLWKLRKLVDLELIMGTLVIWQENTLDGTEDPIHSTCILEGRRIPENPDKSHTDSNLRIKPGSPELRDSNNMSFTPIIFTQYFTKARITNTHGPKKNK